MNLEPNQLLFIYFDLLILRSCHVETLNRRIFPLDYRYREIYGNSDKAENIKDSTKPTHVSLDIFSAVVVDTSSQLMRENIDCC